MIRNEYKFHIFILFFSSFLTLSSLPLLASSEDENDKRRIQIINKLKTLEGKKREEYLKILKNTNYFIHCFLDVQESSTQELPPASTEKRLEEFKNPL